MKPANGISATSNLIDLTAVQVLHKSSTSTNGFCSLYLVTCLSLLIFALASFPIVFSQQISYAVKLPTGYWWIFSSKYPKLMYGNELTISSVAVTTGNIYKVTGSLYGKPISGHATFLCRSIPTNMDKVSSDLDFDIWFAYR
jgi:hypothetical protein